MTAPRFRSDMPIDDTGGRTDERLAADADTEGVTWTDELATVTRLVRELGPVVVNVGHGRDRDSILRARAFLHGWAEHGGHIGAVVSWPPSAASWLRPAARLARGADTWVIADQPGGWAGIGPRLAATGRWRADRTVAFSGLADPTLPSLAGVPATDGLRGATHDGRIWQLRGTWLRISRTPRPDR
jgi:hypothetical protein